MMNFFYIFVFQLCFMNVFSQNWYITPTSFPGINKLSTYSIEDLITDSTVNPSQSIIYVATYYKGIIALSLINTSILLEFSPLSSFNTTGHPILIQSLGDEYILIVSNINDGQLIEIYDVRNASSCLTSSSDVLNSSDIRDLVVSKDYNYIYGVDYQYSLFILNITNKSQIIWSYKNENLTNMRTTNIVVTNDGNLLYFFIIELNENVIRIVNITNLANVTYVNPLFYGWINFAIIGLTISSTDVIAATACAYGTNDFFLIKSGIPTMIDNSAYYSFGTCDYETPQAFASIDSNYIVGGLTGTQIWNFFYYPEWQETDVLPVYRWNTPSSNIHVLSNNYIIQENGQSGELSSLVLKTMVPPFTILSRYMYFSEDYLNVYLPKIPGGPIWTNGMNLLMSWNHINCVLQINPTTLFIGIKKYGTDSPSAFLCSFKIHRPSFSGDSLDYVNGQNYYIDLNNLTLSSNGYYDNVNDIVYAFLDNSGTYLFIYSNEDINGFCSLSIYDAKQTKELVVLKRIPFSFGYMDNLDSVSMTQLGKILYWIPYGTFSIQNCIQSLNFSNITNANIPTKVCINRSGHVQTGLASCTLGNDSYLFYKFSSDPFLHVAIVFLHNFGI